MTGSYTSHAPPAPGPRPDTLRWIGVVLHCARLPTTPPRSVQCQIATIRSSDSNDSNDNQEDDANDNDNDRCEENELHEAGDKHRVVYILRFLNIMEASIRSRQDMPSGRRGGI